MIATKQKPTFLETDLVRAVCRDSLYEFVKEFWYIIIPEEPIWNWHIKYLCDEVQLVIERIFAKKPKEYDLLINVPPGTTKSSIVSVMLPVWVWTRQKSFRTIVATHTYNPLGLDLSRKSRYIIRSEKYQETFPDIELREDQDTKGYFANCKGGSRLVATVGGVSPIGLHAHLLVVDDPIDPKEARTVTRTDIDEANRWIAEDLQGRKIDKRIVPMIMLMQRLAEDDPTEYWQKKGGEYKKICLPADISEGFKVVPSKLKEKYQDGLLDPVRLPRNVLVQEKKGLGEWSYSAQYGQDPIPAGGNLFKVDKLRENLKMLPRPSCEMRRIVRFWDKAATEGAGARTAGVKLGEDQEGRVWVMHVHKGQWGIDRRDNEIRKMAESDGPGVKIGMEEEGGASGKTEAKFAVRQLAGYNVETFKPTGSKEVRAQPVASQVNQGNIYLVEGDWNDEFIQELQYFPNGRFKDQVDGLSGAYDLLLDTPYTLEDWLPHAF